MLDRREPIATIPCSRNRSEVVTPADVESRRRRAREPGWEGRRKGARDNRSCPKHASLERTERKNTTSCDPRIVSKKGTTDRIKAYPVLGIVGGGGEALAIIP